MEWLVLFAAIGLAVGSVVWLAGRALRRRRAAGGREATPPGEAGPGPRHVDVAAVGRSDVEDPGP